jgi:hypothetical protein
MKGLLSTLTRTAVPADRLVSTCLSVCLQQLKSFGSCYITDLLHYCVNSSNHEKCKCYFFPSTFVEHVRGRFFPPAQRHIYRTTAQCSIKRNERRVRIEPVSTTVRVAKCLH